MQFLILLKKSKLINLNLKLKNFFLILEKNLNFMIGEKKINKNGHS